MHQFLSVNEVHPLQALGTCLCLHNEPSGDMDRGRASVPWRLLTHKFDVSVVFPGKEGFHTSPRSKGVGLFFTAR